VDNHDLIMMKNIQSVRREMRVFRVSAKRGADMQDLLKFVESGFSGSRLLQSA
jgi:Ni2+-binding GTPase involved in maturation of urease and hydrogenase